MLDRAERLCRQCIAALESGGDEAAKVAALACLALQEWDALMGCVADAFGDRRCVVYRFAPTLADLALIETALERFPPGRDHWTLARKTLMEQLGCWGGISRGAALDADPTTPLLRAIHGCEATPCDQILRALCDALQWAFRHNSPLPACSGEACRAVGGRPKSALNEQQHRPEAMNAWECRR
jgi:hypothetical protein